MSTTLILTQQALKSEDDIIQNPNTENRPTFYTETRQRLFSIQLSERKQDPPETLADYYAKLSDTGKKCDYGTHDQRYKRRSKIAR